MNVFNIITIAKNESNKKYEEGRVWLNQPYTKT